MEKSQREKIPTNPSLWSDPQTLNIQMRSLHIVHFSTQLNHEQGGNNSPDTWGDWRQE